MARSDIAPHPGRRQHRHGIGDQALHHHVLAAGLELRRVRWSVVARAARALPSCRTVRYRAGATDARSGLDLRAEAAMDEAYRPRHGIRRWSRPAIERRHRIVGRPSKALRECAEGANAWPSRPRRQADADGAHFVGTAAHAEVRRPSAPTTTRSSLRRGAWTSAPGRSSSIPTGRASPRRRQASPRPGHRQRRPGPHNAGEDAMASSATASCSAAGLPGRLCRRGDEERSAMESSPAPSRRGRFGERAISNGGCPRDALSALPARGSRPGHAWSSRRRPQAAEEAGGTGLSGRFQSHPSQDAAGVMNADLAEPSADGRDPDPEDDAAYATCAASARAPARQWRDVNGPTPSASRARRLPTVSRSGRARVDQVRAGP